jgi:methionine synthase I (cobalamin-dependent)
MSHDFLYSISGNATMLPLNKEFDEVTEKFRTSIGTDNVCVSVIYKIQNPELNTAFEARRKAITEVRKTPPDVVNVFHGTTLAAAANIVNTGFDPAYSKIAAYGKGPYASPSVKTAISYCKDVRQDTDFSMIFLCRFLKGTRGTAGNGNIIDTSKADYCGSGDILVTPYADGIIPDYLLCYYKWT